jgi:protein phosphatase
MKHLTPDEVASFPHKNVIVRALGMKSTVQVDVFLEHPRLGDVYVLCSDGLSGMMTDAEMASLVSDEPDLDRMCERLIAVANANGGLDNVTVVAVRVERE